MVRSMTQQRSSFIRHAESAPPRSHLDRRSPNYTPIVAELDAEWARLRAQRRVLVQMRSWPVDGALADAIQHAANLDDIVRATQPYAVGFERAGATLRALVEIAASDDLAARIVLQRILGGLLNASKRWHHDHRSGSPVDQIIGAAWIAIRQFEPGRAARHIAPALIADALWIGLRRERRRKATTLEVPVPTDKLAQTPAEVEDLHAWPALAATLRAAEHAGVDASHLDTIRTLTRTGSTTRAADHFGVTARTIRTRRTTAAHEIRAALGRDWADWTDPILMAA